MKGDFIQNKLMIMKIPSQICHILTYSALAVLSVSCQKNEVDTDKSLMPVLDYSISVKIPTYDEIKKQTKGHLSLKEEVIGIIRKNDTIAVIEISEPSVVAVADKDYPWGWFQFPTMGVNKDGIISVEWQMKRDSAEDYGDSKGDDNVKVSFDNGKTWTNPNGLNIPAFREQVTLPNGEILSISTQPSVDISTISNFPSPVLKCGNQDFFNERDLPEKFKGVYVNYFIDNTKRTVQAKVENDNLIRSVTNNLISTIWFGKLTIKSNAIYACVYPSYYMDESSIKPCSISLYKSVDYGKSWKIQGIIDYQVDERYHPNHQAAFNAKGFYEPTFEFLKDGRILCIMRTSGELITPMYKSYSSDEGINWSKPEPITPNGVMPQLIKLDNDVLVLASGRPGVQLRFSCDGNGEEWTTPIEMIDYDENAHYENDTCGYPFLYKAADNEVYIVYSNFKEKTTSGGHCKSIVFRKIKVKRL